MIKNGHYSLIIIPHPDPHILSVYYFLNVPSEFLRLLNGSNLCFSGVINQTEQTLVRFKWGKYIVLYRNKTSSQENLTVACEHQENRPACAHAQSEQRLCYSLSGKSNCVHYYM